MAKHVFKILAIIRSKDLAEHFKYGQMFPKASIYIDGEYTFIYAGPAVSEVNAELFNNAVIQFIDESGYA